MTAKAIGVASEALEIPAKNDTASAVFANAVEEHKAMVYSIALRILRDRTAAEDLAQDVFLELHRNWKRMQSADHVLFWLRQVVTRRAIDVMRKRRLRSETSLENTAEPTVLEHMHDAMLSSYLKRMINSLPEKQRIVVVLRYQESMTPDDIAKLLKMNVSTVKTLISRAIELLRTKTAQNLKQQIDGNGYGAF